jgi:outer membrane protein assembly factor BamD (BamD/ComL family)
MNLPAKILLAAALLLGAHAHAEFVRKDGAWQVKPGTAADVSPPSRLPVLLLAMDHASGRLEAGDIGGALKEWEIIAEANVGAEAEAIALLTRARIFVGRGEFEKASQHIDDIFARHSGFPGFGAVVELQFEIANRLAEGQRRKLGGWFPWFSDRQSAISEWEKTIRLAPNGPRADECLILIARLARDEDLTEKTNEALERLVSDHPGSKHAPEALEMLATLRAKESMGPAWDQATTLEAADHWRTLADQFPNDPRAKKAVAEIAVLRDRAARARLSLARFYFFNRNNPEAAKLMANACRNIAPESAAAKEAEALLAAMLKDPVPPKTIADRLLGTVPRPRSAADTKPQVIGQDLDSLGFKKEPAKAAVGPDNR